VPPRITPRGTAANGAAAEPDAPTRILQATAQLLAERGVARFNLQEVAEAAAVSKGLIHYHYHDRDTLLTRLVEALAADVARRRAAALAQATPATAVDDLWAWLRGELRRGHLRVLQELTQEPGDLVRAAVHAAHRLRTDSAAASLDALFALIGLRPRVPVPLLASVVVAFEDGLVLGNTVEPEQEARVVFDVFWLGVLGLVE
jgi:AcrR family transcriptional regulator